MGVLRLSYWGKLLGKIEDRFLLPQQQAFFDWAVHFGAMGAEEEIGILLESETYCSYRGGRWRKSWQRERNKQLAFVFVGAGLFHEKLALISELDTDWTPIFQTSVLEIWENKRRHRGLLPLRFGYSSEEKERVLKEVRRMLGQVLSGAQMIPPQTLSLRFDLPQNLDIAVWVDGQIRASVIIEGLSCRDALIAGVKRVPQDGRFKPLELDELSRAKIELTMMSDLELPLTYGEYIRNDIDPTKAYVVRRGRERGWYLPEVHNVKSFENLEKLCASLAFEKAAMPQGVVTYRNFYQFPVIDWVETETGLLSLSGPTPSLSLQNYSDKAVFRLGQQAVAHLGRIMDRDGLLPAIIYPNQPVRPIVDWARLGCAGHALAVWGKRTQDEKITLLARRVWDYLHRFAPFAFLRASSRHATVVYYARLGLALGETIDPALIEAVVGRERHTRDNPIFKLQLLTLLLEWDGTQVKKRYQEIVVQEAERIFLEFQDKKEKSQTALYPELLAIFYRLEQLSQDGGWKKRAQEMIDWYRKVQRGDGSFPHSPERIFAYTRGTGKLFEVLAFYPEEAKVILEPVIRWLETMQYTENNTFHIHPKTKPDLLGGFRHDAMNREVWIDASAHVIIGVARLLCSK